VGILATILSAAFLTAALAAGGRAFLKVAAGVVLAHIPVMVADGFVTGAAVLFILRVRPDLLGESRMGTVV
jgi:cobalt/nickel transport system permease protein